MDKESDERMAPALHSTKHETASEVMKTFKLSPSSSPCTINSPEKDFFTPVNGALTDSCLADTISATDSVKDSSHFTLLEYKASSKLPSYPSKGASGDNKNASISTKDEVVHLTGVPVTSVHLGCGDAINKPKTNGWPTEYKSISNKSLQDLKPESHSSVVTSDERAVENFGLEVAKDIPICDDSTTDCLKQNSSVHYATGNSLEDAHKHLGDFLALCQATSVKVDESCCVVSPINTTATITTTAVLKNKEQLATLQIPTSVTMSASTNSVYEGSFACRQDLNSHASKELNNLSVLSSQNTTCVVLDAVVSTSSNTTDLQSSTKAEQNNDICKDCSILNPGSMSLTSTCLTLTDSSSSILTKTVSDSGLSRADLTCVEGNNSTVLPTNVFTAINTLRKSASNISSCTTPVTATVSTHAPDSNSLTALSDTCLAQHHQQFNQLGAGILSSKDTTVVDNSSGLCMNNCPLSSTPSVIPNNTMFQKEISEMLVNHSNTSENVNCSLNNTFEQKLNNSNSKHLVESDFGVTQTTDIHDSNSSISSHCVNLGKSTDIYNKQKLPIQEPSIPLNNVSDMMELAHGLVTGNHMQHLPLKLTNTLQELAASITRNQIIETELEVCKEKSTSECNKSKAASTKSPNVGSKPSHFTEKILNIEELNRRHKLQHSDTVKRNLLMENQIYRLKARLNHVRAAGISRYSRKQLSFLIKGKTSCSTSSLFENGINPIWPQNSNQPSLRKTNYFFGENIKEGLDISKVDKFKDTHMNQHYNLWKASKLDSPSKLGVLKKELRNTRVRFDPDMTDDSSDEDVFEDTKRKYVFASTAESLFTSQAASSQPVQNTALWTWAHDRTSVARRWTWLQAQVFELDFKINQHNEVFKQLRAAKGKVLLGNQALPTNEATSTSNDLSPICTTKQEVSSSKIYQNSDASSDSVGTDAPYRINQLVKNINKQTLNLLDNLPPMSTPSPATVKHQHQKASKNSSQLPDVSTFSSQSCNDTEFSSARTRPLKYPLRHRKVVRASNVSYLSYKKLRPPTVYNDSSIMDCEFTEHTPFHRGDGRSRDIIHSSISTRATLHDHSYHKTLSTTEDIPISLRLNGHMKTNNKRYSGKLGKSESAAEKKYKKKQKEAKRKEDRLLDKLKSNSRSASVVLERADRLIRSVSACHRNNSADERSSLYEARKRRSGLQSADFNKRSRVMSVDSDADSLHVRSEGGTPTMDSSFAHSSNPQFQAVLKRKRASDQAYDINNIVIPHGLSTTRIEKLQYKEILTPGWRATKKGTTEEKAEKANEEAEELSDTAYQARHDRYEIMEKKKYMAYAEWNMNKKNGSRSMSRANLALDEEASSFFYPSFRASPTASFSSNDLPSPTSPDLFVTPAMVRSRRSSSELAVHTSSSHVTNRRRFPDSISSDDGSLTLHDGSNPDSWERRRFPLSNVDYDELHKDPVVCLEKLSKDFDVDRRFRPIKHSFLDTNTAPRHKNFKSTDVPGSKRVRTFSQASILSRDDERHSDDSTTSSTYSSKRVKQSKSDISRRASPVAPPVLSLPKRHKPTIKDDFYYYSELGSETESESEDESLVSDDEKTASHKSSSSLSSLWVAKPISRESTPKRGSTSGDEYATGAALSPSTKAPLLLKIKKK